MNQAQPLPPGACIGILGGGQLGRFLALRARDWGYRVAIWQPANGEASAAMALADETFDAPWTDSTTLDTFAACVDVATFELEHFPADVVQGLAQRGTRIYPNDKALTLAQNRQLEKQGLADMGLPVTPFVPVNSKTTLQAALAELGAPCILKAAQGGYDGKGQWAFATEQEALAGWQPEWEGQPFVLEPAIPFRRELSLVCARSQSGQIVCYPLVENRHHNHILAVTLAPAPNLSTGLQQQAEIMAHQLLTRLDYVGVLAIEWFEVAETDSGTPTLLINEIAPRPHNSGHWTLDGCLVDQFEQQLRAICGWPLAPATLTCQGAVMQNILGEPWHTAAPKVSPNEVCDGFTAWATAALQRESGLKFHWYGKRQAQPGRKMGHWCLTSPSESADQLLPRLLYATGGPHTVHPAFLLQPEEPCAGSCLMS